MNFEKSCYTELEKHDTSDPSRRGPRRSKRVSVLGLDAPLYVFENGQLGVKHSIKASKARQRKRTARSPEMSILGPNQSSGVTTLKMTLQLTIATNPHQQRSLRKTGLATKRRYLTKKEASNGNHCFRRSQRIMERHARYGRMLTIK